jgi:hypothetical protein
MLIDGARDYARRESASTVLLHHVLLACADRSEAGAVLARSGWRGPDEKAGEGETPRRIAPEVTLHLAWVKGLRTALPPSSDFAVAFLLSCVIGPTSAAHRWLQRRGVDLDRLGVAAAAALGLPEEIGTRRERWSQDVVVLSPEEVAAYTDELRMAGRRYKIGAQPDGSVVVVPSE